MTKFSGTHLKTNQTKYVAADTKLSTMITKELSEVARDETKSLKRSAQLNVQRKKKKVSIKDVKRNKILNADTVVVHYIARLSSHLQKLFDLKIAICCSCCLPRFFFFFSTSLPTPDYLRL